MNLRLGLQNVICLSSWCSDESFLSSAKADLPTYVKVCRKKILDASSDYRMAMAYNSVGSMAPLSVFPCGHSFHSHCLIAHVTRCTTATQAEYILDLQKQLTLLGMNLGRKLAAA